MTTHRAIQVANLADRAWTNRTRYLVNSSRAARLGNWSASFLLSQKAAQWERVWIKCARRLST